MSDNTCQHTLFSLGVQYQGAEDEDCIIPRDELQDACVEISECCLTGLLDSLYLPCSVTRALTHSQSALTLPLCPKTASHESLSLLAKCWGSALNVLVAYVSSTKWRNLLAKEPLWRSRGKFEVNSSPVYLGWTEAMDFMSLLRRRVSKWWISRFCRTKVSGVRAWPCLTIWPKVSILQSVTWRCFRLSSGA